MKINELNLFERTTTPDIHSVRNTLSSYVAKYISGADWKIEASARDDSLYVVGNYPINHATSVVRVINRDNHIDGWVADLDRGTIVLTKDRMA